MSTVTVIEYSSQDFPERIFSRREILRYMGCSASSTETESLIDKGISQIEGKLCYKVVYSQFPIKAEGKVLDLGFAKVESQDLSKALYGCDSIILFAATIGLEIDRLILKYGRISPSLAVCLQAIGTEHIEALCNEFCLEMKRKLATDGKHLTPRFSAGYGDLPLDLQRQIFSALRCEKSIGLTLNDSLLMSPTKSVTAIIGIKNNKESYENT